MTLYSGLISFLACLSSQWERAELGPGWRGSGLLTVKELVDGA